MQNNSIIGVFGKKGSGKSYLVKKALKKMNRYIIVDPMHEYNGVICNSYHEVVDVLVEYLEYNFKIVYRPPNDEDIDNFFQILNTDEMVDYTFVMEEADLHCSAWYLHPEIKKLTRYGRHSGRNLIFVSRRPAAVSRDMTSQMDVMISFTQIEPIDLKYFSNFRFNRDVETLGEYEWSYNGDVQVITNILGLEVPKGGDLSNKTE